MKIDLGKILTRSWQIIWNYRVLWIFGILAGFANSNGSSNSNSSSSNGDTTSFNGNTDQFIEQAGEFFQEYMLIIIAVCVLLLILSFVFYALGMMGRIGILKGVYKVEEGATSLIFAELWSESMPYFWRFFGLNFLVGFVAFIIILPASSLALLRQELASLACCRSFVCSFRSAGLSASFWNRHRLPLLPKTSTCSTVSSAVGRSQNLTSLG